MDDRAHSAAHLRATLKKADSARKECDDYVVLPLTCSSTGLRGASAAANERESDDFDDPSGPSTKVLLLTRFFRRLTKKYGEVERCFGASNKASEMTPFQFFLPNATSAREHRVYVECAVEKKKVPAVKICTDATSFEKSELRMKFLEEESDEVYAKRNAARNEERVLRVLPDAVVNFLTKQESKFQAFGHDEQTGLRRFILRSTRSNETTTTTTSKKKNTDKDFLNFTVEGLDVERPFVVYRGYKCATARSISERDTASESVLNASLEFTTVRPFSMALKRLGDLKVACQRANVPAEDMVQFFSSTKKRKAVEAKNGNVEQLSAAAVLDISATPLCVVALPRVSKQAVVVCLRRELPLSLGFACDEEFLHCFAAFQHLSTDKESLLDLKRFPDIFKKKEFWGVKYADVIFEGEPGRWLYPITLLLKNNGATEIPARNTEEYSQSLIVKNFAESIESTTHLGISVSFFRDQENDTIKREAMANRNNVSANGDILDADAGHVTIDPLLQALQTHSPPFLGFRLALDEYNDPMILENTPNTRRSLRRASSLSVENQQHFNNVVHDLGGGGCGNGVGLSLSQSMPPVTLDLNQPLSICDQEKMNLSLEQQRHFLSAEQVEEAIIDGSKTKKAKTGATTTATTKTQTTIIKTPPPKVNNVPKISGSSTKTTKKKTGEKDSAEKRLNAISGILRDETNIRRISGGPKFLTIDDLLFFLASKDPDLSTSYRKKIRRRDCGRVHVLEAALQFIKETERSSRRTKNRIA